MDNIQRNVSAVRSDIEKTLSKSDCKDCSKLGPDLEKLTLDTSIPVSTDFPSPGTDGQILNGQIQTINDNNNKSKITEVDSNTSRQLSCFIQKMSQV